MFTRRDFIKVMGWLGGIILTPLGRLRRWESTDLARADAPPEGELYAGFLLLPEGTPIPPMVSPSELGVPIMCGVGVGRGGPHPTAVTKYMNTHHDLAQEVSFPVYTFYKLPGHLRAAGAHLIKHETGEVFSAAVNFDSYNLEAREWEEGTVSISADPDFPRPFPLWSSNPVEPGGPATTLEKVDFLPAPGIMVVTQDGYVFHWIENEILFTMVMEHTPSLEEARSLARSLVMVE